MWEFICLLLLLFVLYGSLVALLTLLVIALGFLIAKLPWEK
jgi:energy-coupling factor transporter transmembrane protein EcfT